jgi:hypothetical protein
LRAFRLRKLQHPSTSCVRQRDHGQQYTHQSGMDWLGVMNE